MGKSGLGGRKVFHREHTSLCMSGIIFLGTKKLEEIVDFYVGEVGARIWLKQADCTILEHGNMLFGFCQRETCETGGMLTFFYPTRQEVDQKYHQFRDLADEGPKTNEKYAIYHFFARDPEGRSIEFQSFNGPELVHPSGGELLITRRSVRDFQEREIPDELLTSIFRTCRFAPTSCNSESYYYQVIRDRETLDFLASRRGSSSSPIGKGAIAVAIISDPERTRRPIQDGCIGAYHFLLSCWNVGIGTCWIAAMDRDDVKDRLGIPSDHYIATITPVGFPTRLPSAPKRRAVEEMIRHP